MDTVALFSRTVKKEINSPEGTVTHYQNLSSALDMARELRWVLHSQMKHDTILFYMGLLSVMKVLHGLAS